MARWDLGIPEAEVGALTMREYDALLKRKQAQDNRARLCAGIVAAAIYNTAPGDPHRKPVNPYDFVPGGRETEEAASQTDMRDMEPGQQLNYLMKMFGSQVVRKE